MIFIFIEGDSKNISMVVCAKSKYHCIQIILDKFHYFDNMFLCSFKKIFADFIVKKHLNALQKRKKFIKKLVHPEVVLDWINTKIFDKS